MNIRLLVACREKHPALALCAQIVQAGDGRIAGEATDKDGVLKAAAVTPPDVLMLQYTHAQDEGQRAWRVLSRISQLSGHTRVLLLCDAYTHRSIIDFIQRGVAGCVLTSSEPSLHAKAVLAVHQGETWFGRNELMQAIRGQMVADPAVTSDVLEDQELLTAREREILAMIGRALSNKEIARQLRISDQTVKTHLHNIYVKLEKSGRYKAFLTNVVAAPSPHSAIPHGMRQGGFAAD